MTTSTDLLVRPSDPDYDRLRLGFQRSVTHEPRGVVRATSPADVQHAVRLAADLGVRVAVQATGHGVGATDHDTVLVDTSGWRGVVVDPARRTATVGAGARWSDVVAAAAPHGLAPLSGSAPGVGVIGYLVGGGLPILGRRYGWAAGSIRAMDVVTADGESARVTPDGELGRTLAGGGGGTALVTSATISLVALRSVFGGALTFAPDTPDALAAAIRTWREWAGELGDTTSTSIALVPFPDASRPRLVVRVAHAGDPAEGARLVAPLRRSAPLQADSLDVLPWTRSGDIHADPVAPSATAHESVALDGLTDAAVDAVVSSARTTDVPRVVEVRRLGGALGRPTALPVRDDVEWHVGVVSILGAPGHRAAARRADTTLRRAFGDADRGRLANFLFDRGGDPDAVRSAHREAEWSRLGAAKTRFDPSARILAAAPVPVRPS